MTVKAMNETTGTVHEARATSGWAGSRVLVQVCGFNANTATGQIAYLAEVPADTEITCRKCSARTVKPVSKAAPVRRTFGRQEWTLGDLREAAKLNGIKGYSRMDGEDLLAAVIAVAPQFA